MPPSNLPELIAAATLAGLTALSAGMAAPAGAATSGAPTATSPTVVAPQPVTTAAHAALAGPLQVFFGNLHSHTHYSDGTGTPAEAFAFARDEGGLDFLAITEHNHNEAEAGAGDRADGVMIATSPELYDGPQASSLVSAAAAATQPGTFVALYGQEFSTISQGNHVNVFDTRGVISVGKGQFKELVETWLPAHPDTTGSPQLVQFNHPFSKGPADVGAPADTDDDDEKQARKEYGADDFGTREAWIAAMDRHAELIEVFNGPGTNNGTGLTPARTQTQYLKYLNLGFHLAPTGDQDNHHRTWGTLSEARTGVIAASLTKANILGALKARHTFATLDKNLRFVARAVVNGEEHLMGDFIPPPAPGTAFEIHYVLLDEDEPTMQYDIDVLSDIVGGTDIADVIHPVDQSGNTPAAGARITGLTYDGGRQYFLLRVTQKPEHGSRDVLWTAPIWFEQPTAAPPPGPAAPDASAFVASRNSGIFHVSDECRFAKQVAPANRVTGANAAQGRTMHVGCPVQ